MKRSEMVKILGNVLLADNWLAGVELDRVPFEKIRLINKILTTCEEAGMVPPVKTSGIEIGGKPVFFSTDWDPEDKENVHSCYEGHCS